MYAKAQLLLVGSIIAGIAFVGCIFELSSGAPDWGATATWAILALSLPIGVFCFLNAVKLARASMEE
ncbi:hypothetical protein Pse7367_1540 [Thalassoporum mexicanum PCC 7367]|uniref:hypothetical protein n=1 Tax=Thalassoporum mexicanum TaxID=3457544 RepID=UPI00029FD20D|nr:hypothetical protein [Pseudanabaena sp. PCC 7367]AFY69829.1 hypothetical protein Pse7367_1540 [Pseudanabaena sp. PCC 7367]